MKKRPKIIGVKEAAKILSLSTKRVKVLSIEGRIQGQKINNSWVFFEDDVIEFSKQKRESGRPTTKWKKK